MFLGRVGKGDGFIELASPRVDEHRQPPLWHPDIQRLAYSQNVAGLWLKYGAKTPNIWTSLRRKILPHVRQFVDEER